MNKLKTVCLLASLCAGSANATLFNFTGDITYHNDVVYTYFSLDNDATNVRLWTDSFQSGTNFDPITALWDASGNLIDENDDNDLINPSTQTYYDSGFELGFLGAGDYILSVATYANFAAGSSLSEGFDYDDQTPILLSEWSQPANSFDMGTYWSVWLDGVDTARNPDDPRDDDPVMVSEPTTLGLFSLSLLGLGILRKRKVTQST